jgi:tetratricopeptide (TPR) repeat protein
MDTDANKILQKNSNEFISAVFNGKSVVHTKEKIQGNSASKKRVQGQSKFTFNNNSAQQPIQVIINLGDQLANKQNEVNDEKPRIHPASIAPVRIDQNHQAVSIRSTPLRTRPDNCSSSNIVSDLTKTPEELLTTAASLEKDEIETDSKPWRLGWRTATLSTAALLAFLLAGFLLGRMGQSSAPDSQGASFAKPSPDLLEQLDKALKLVQSGQASEALGKINKLSESNPNVPSLEYLAALAAIQSGDMKTAQAKASLSIQKNQKVSDSLVLLSMAETSPRGNGGSSLRDAKIVRESLLWQAVESDLANPSPMIELASFLRSQNRNDEALQLLTAASARLHPIDTHVVVETSIQLMKLEQISDSELPASTQGGSIPEAFASVYISLRKKDYNQAEIALEKCRQQASPDLFAYLLNDPVFKPFQSEGLMSRALSLL